MGAFSQGNLQAPATVAPGYGGPSASQSPGLGSVTGCTGMPLARAVPFRQPMKYIITGTTKDSTGAALGNCSLNVYEIIPGGKDEPKGRLVAMAVSDAAGAYTVEVCSATGMTFQIEAYKTGVPDVTGVTLNTLTGTAV